MPTNSLVTCFFKLMTLYGVLPIRLGSVTGTMNLESLHIPCWALTVEPYETSCTASEMLPMSNTSLSPPTTSQCWMCTC